jgi:hypothetical protein
MHDQRETAFTTVRPYAKIGPKSYLSVFGLMARYFRTAKILVRLSLAKKHHAFRIVIELILHAGKARAHTPFENDDGPGVLDFQNLHLLNSGVNVSSRVQSVKTAACACKV